MNNPPVVRIITHPFFARYEHELKGFYKEPTTPDMDMLFAAIDLRHMSEDLRKTKAIIDIFDSYSLFCNAVHLFVLRTNQDYSIKHLKNLETDLRTYKTEFAPITLHILPADFWCAPSRDTKFEDEFNVLVNVLMNGSLKLEKKLESIPDTLDDDAAYIMELPSDEDKVVSFPAFNIHHIP